MTDINTTRPLKEHDNEEHPYSVLKTVSNDKLSHKDNNITSKPISNTNLPTEGSAEVKFRRQNANVGQRSITPSVNTLFHSGDKLMLKENMNNSILNEGGVNPNNMSVASAKSTEHINSKSNNEEDGDRIIVTKGTAFTKRGKNPIQSTTVTTDVVYDISYLTNPQSERGKLFYLLRDKKTYLYKFQDEFIDNYLGNLTTKILNDFLTEVNKLGFAEQIQSKQMKMSTKLIAIAIGILLILISPILYFIVMPTIKYPYVEIGNIILSAISAFLVVTGLTILVFGFFLLIRQIDLQPLYYKQFPVLRGCIERWNQITFLDLGVKATTVKNLSYIQFTLKTQILLLEPHVKPVNLYGFQQYNYDLLDPYTNTAHEKTITKNILENNNKESLIPDGKVRKHIVLKMVGDKVEVAKVGLTNGFIN
jgi:hypothetical protein